MREHLDIYRKPNTRFHVLTWSGRCMLTPLALAVEIESFDFAKVLSVLVNNADIKPNEAYVIDDLRTGLRIRTNALTYLIARWGKTESEKTRIKVLHALLKYGADARAPAVYKVTLTC